MKELKKFVLIEPRIEGFEGYFFNYSKFIFKQIENRGANTYLICERDSLDKLSEHFYNILGFKFNKNSWKRPKIPLWRIDYFTFHLLRYLTKKNSPLNIYFNKKISLIKSKRLFFLDKKYILTALNESCKKTGYNEETFLFFSYARVHFIPPILEFLECFPKGKAPHIGFLIEDGFHFSKYNNQNWRFHFSLAKNTFSKINNSSFKNNFHLFTDMETLLKEGKDLMKTTLELLPLPLASRAPRIKMSVSLNQKKAFIFNKDSKGNHIKKNSFIFGYLGEARIEKGFVHLFPLINELNSLRKKYKIEFTIQASFLKDNKSHAVNDCIKKLELMHAQLIRTSMTIERYYTIFNSIDVVLLPYSSFYEKRTSGIFVESILAGKIPLVSRNTWMHRQLHEYDLANELVFDPENPQEFKSVVEGVCENYDAIKNKILSMREQWKQFHNPQTYVDRLLAPMLQDQESLPLPKTIQNPTHPFS